ncbi:acetylxylan esterase [candidate division KSB1 bacterium]
MSRCRFWFVVLSLICFSIPGRIPAAHGAVPPDSLEISIGLDRPDHIYTLGETARFTIRMRLGGKAVERDSLDYRLSNDGAAVIEEGVVAVNDGTAEIAGRMAGPGFLRLDISRDGLESRRSFRAAAAFNPTAIMPTTPVPENYDLFWNQGKAELERIPVDPRETESPERSSDDIRVINVSLANVDGSRVYGWLSLPTTPGPHPAVLYIPGAGVGPLRPVKSYPKQGVAVFHMSVHGIDNDLPPEYFQKLRGGILRDYPRQGADDPYRFFYRRVILGAFRVLDYLAEREDIDGGRLGVAGSSQGGALSLLVGGLDGRVKALTANVPAMCDHCGHYYGRPSGWPGLWRTGDRRRLERTLGYFDAAVAASRIRVPALMAVGFIDNACPPTTVYAAYNVITGPKTMDNYPLMAHAFGPGWADKAVGWLVDRLKEEGE